MNFLHYLKRILLESESPVWLTILVGFTAAVGTYFIAPSLNYQFELRKIQVQHLVSTADNLNNDMIEFQSKARAFNNDLVNDPLNVERKRSDLLDLIAKIQWRLVDARSVVGGVAGGDRKVVALRDALTNFKRVAESAQSEKDQEALLKVSGPVLASADALLAAIYVKTGFIRQ